MKQKLFLTLAMLVVMCSFCNAQSKVAYAIYTSGNQTLSFYYDTENREGDRYDLNTGSTTPKWIDDGKKFKRVVFALSFADYRPTSTYKWFYEQNELTVIDKISYLKTDNVTTMAYMFYGCSGLKSLTLSEWNTSNVKSMSNMFKNCSDLTSLDVSGWDTGKVTQMSDLFCNCSGLTGLNVGGWDTSNVTNMSFMFYGCSSLTSLNVVNWKTGKVGVMSYMFQSCSGLTSLNLSGWDTRNVEKMANMFDNCSSLTSLNVGNWNTGKVTVMSKMFFNCSSLTSLDVSKFNTSNVTMMDYMFYKCSGLKSLDVSKFNTTNVKSMYFMFYECSGLKSLDVSGWDTRNVTNMAYMFNGCSGLKSLDVSRFNTTNVTTMFQMFDGCSSLTSLDVSGWDTEKVTTMNGMFISCSGLTNLDVSGFNTTNVTDMFNMFNGCSGLTNLNVCGWDTSNVESMTYLFQSCNGLTSLDLSSFNTRSVTSMGAMFKGCSNLITIYVGDGWNTEKVSYSDGMFTNCSKLVGGKGTPYSSSHKDKEYARIDGGTTNPGYLTYKRFAYPLWIGGVQVTEKNKNNIPIENSSSSYSTQERGSAVYNPDSKVLLLTNAIIKGSTGIYNGDKNNSNSTTCIDGLTVDVSGKCSIESDYNPMIIKGNTYIINAHAEGVDTLLMTGANSINVFDKTLRFANRATSLAVTGDGNLFKGIGDNSSLVFTNGASFGGYCTGKVVNNMMVTVDSGSDYLYIADGSTITFNSTDKCLYVGDEALTGILMIGKYYPLWLGDVHLSSAFELTPFFNQLVPVKVRAEKVLSLDKLVVTGSLPSYVTKSNLLCTAPLLDFYMTDDTYFITNVSGKAGIELQGKGICTIKGTGTLYVTSENGPAVMSADDQLIIEDVDIEVSGKTGGFTNLNNLSLTNVAGTATCESGYVVSNTGYLYIYNSYITNNVSFDNRNKRIASTRLELDREYPITTGESLPLNDNGEMINDKARGSWYTIDGQKLSGMPTKKGIYIQNGKKQIVK